MIALWGVTRGLGWAVREHKPVNTLAILMLLVAFLVVAGWLRQDRGGDEK